MIKMKVYRHDFPNKHGGRVTNSQAWLEKNTQWVHGHWNHHLQHWTQ